MEKVARTDSSVLITGESGTGKELVARAIHFSSERANNRFLPINCGALPENLLESELFGYKRGAFTGAGAGQGRPAQGGRQGHLSSSTRSASMPLALQVKLLRALQEREAYPLGANDPVAFDVRVLCATNKNLEAEVKAGRFREELLYRINVITINLPRAARAPGRHPAAGQSFPAQVREVAGAHRDALFQGRDAPDAQLCVARQRPRAGKHGRARCDPGRDRRHPFARPARQAAQHVAARRCRDRELGT